MSDARRAYDLLRGYVNREWDRIRGIEDSDAARELDAALAEPKSADSVATDYSATGPQNPKAFARSILGVSETATFVEIRRSFERLHKRSSPENFAPNSDEARQAADILKRVNWAYRTLTEEVDSVQMRFSSLEIEEVAPPPKQP
ncbi:MAG: J domain-containing protein [Fimbriimonadaceae bacterium]|nr:J domain-containing protein [Fimbriimonadaceae bacterium]